MAEKLTDMTRLYEHILPKLTRDADEWRSFLSSAGRNYKLRFDEQAMIYAQDPKATAVLELDKWNSVYGRWVNRGTRGIAVFSYDTPGTTRLKYFFDINNTHEGRHPRPVIIWEMMPEYEADAIETLADSYGEDILSAKGLSGAITMSAAIATKENIDAYEEHLVSSLSGSGLADIDESEIFNVFFGTVRASVAYMTLSRCGYDADSIINSRHFDDIDLFDTPQTAEILGNTVSDIAETGLREISSTVLSIMRDEKNGVRTFANSGSLKDNAIQKPADTITEDEGSEKDDKAGDGLQRNGGRQPDTESEPEGGARGEPRAFREDEAEIPEGAEEADVQPASHDDETDGTPRGDRADSERADHSHDGAASEIARADRTVEDGRSDDVGRPDEQHPQDGRAGGDPGDGPRIEEDELPSQDTVRFGRTETEGSGLPFLHDLYAKNIPLETENEKSEASPASGDGPAQLSMFDLPAQDADSSSGRSRFDADSDNTGKTPENPAPENGISTASDDMTSERSLPLSEENPVNFRIIDDDLGHGGAKAKYNANILAIRTLQKIESEDRSATPDEQAILSRYVGWGGLSQSFDEKSSEYAELRALLPSDDYESARATTLNAHYTSPTVVKAIYKAVESMGFTGGNILEPSCGIGNFMGLLPDAFASGKVYGVEIDSLTGRIAQQLYQKNDIRIQGFEDAAYPDNFFDLAVGNVPFGGYGVADRKYDKHRFMIHDYFFAKALDKVRPGGVIAFITSKGTLDKQNPAVRKYIAQRAELIGAIRLPNNAFLKSAGTEVTSDIVFLQKRDRMMDIEPEWVHLGQTSDGVPVNAYFAENPDMILGEMSFEDTMYGNAKGTTCRPFTGADLSRQLEDAVANIHAEIIQFEIESDEPEDRSISADPSVRNFSFAKVGEKIYFRENSQMYEPEMTLTAKERVTGMMAIRDCTRTLIEYQTEDCPDADIKREQERLASLYDVYTQKYGLLTSRGNSMAFGEDSSYSLLASLEEVDEDGSLIRKADMFTKRTIRPMTKVDKVDTSAEALAVSISEKACVDMGFMLELCGRDETEIYEELKGAIFLDSLDGAGVYRTADDFLSGNVRQKLKDWNERLEYFTGIDPGSATSSVSKDEIDREIEICRSNTDALRKIQPEDLNATEIDVRLGATWLPPKIVEQFVFELLDTPIYARNQIAVHYSQRTANWNIKGKNKDPGNIKANGAYGTRRMGAYKIIEETLNLKDVRIFDYFEDDNGKRTAVLNKKETMIAQQKQEQIKSLFTDWIWKDPERRNHIVDLYNLRFNSIRERAYDGSHITFGGINPEIRLYEHQKNAVARILYGGNTLLAHVVGAGKTFEMVAAAMEGKRLGLCDKNLFVVPNHLTEQWASEFMQLYPAANILVSTRKDFEKKNRRKFCSRIATGEYDAIIIGHSQFEKIPLSVERQREELEEQISGITAGVSELKAEQGERFTIKQLEKTKKSLEVKLARLNDRSRKDDVITFEETGVDRLFVDEAHYYKNLYAFTKMRNIGGIAQTEAQKSSDLFMKCRYLDKLTGGKGIVFATGTPISNSMVEMFTLQRYLQYDELELHGLTHFDAWASTFGETVTAIELAPEGTGYRAKTRFARFFNLPELMTMFRQAADIQTSDMIGLPVPKANYHNIVIKPSDMQKDLVSSLSERADRVRKRLVDPSEDNMLVITNDGRKTALDERLINPLLPDREDGKASVIADNVFRIWDETSQDSLTQLIFCDLSTPKNDGSFNVYDDIKAKLMTRGIPEREIAFIHSASTEIQKKEMFAKARSGQIRVLMGSTQKMGAGTNVQDHLIAIHDSDCPWRPSEVGRTLRTG